MKKILLGFLLITVLYGRENTMTVYGNINADMDVWFESIFSARNSKPFLCHETSYNMVTNQKLSVSKRKKVVVDAVRDKNGDYSLDIPLVYPKKSKCDFTIERVNLKVAKKGFKKVIPSGKGGIGESDYAVWNQVYPFRNRYDLDNNKEPVPDLAFENIFECQYYDYSSIGQDSAIECKGIRALGGEFEKDDRGVKIKIDIFLNDTDLNGNRYNPDEEEKSENRNFWNKFISGIFGK